MKFAKRFYLSGKTPSLPSDKPALTCASAGRVHRAFLIRKATLGRRNLCKDDILQRLSLLPPTLSPVRILSSITAVLCFVLSIASRDMAAQTAPAVLSVTGAVPKSLRVTSTELAKLPRASVSSTSNGITTAYEGVWLSDLLVEAGLTLGLGARGGSLSAYILASAADGYQVVFSLGEIDPGITEGKYLVADRANGQPMYGENGTYRLVVPGDKRGARSVRMLSSIRVITVPHE